MPAFDSVIPSTAAISALARPAKNLSATSSRSRGAQPVERGAEREAALALLDALGRGGAVGVDRLGGQLGLAPAPAQLVEGGVAGDPEQPGARLAAAGSKRARLR